MSQLWHNFAKAACKLLKRSGRACKPDSVSDLIRVSEQEPSAIIPLGHDSHRGSSSLPEGFQFSAACATLNGARSFITSADSSSRASSPLLFGLAPRGVFRAPNIAVKAVGSYPTFSPLPAIRANRRRLPGFPVRCHRARSAGGIFSVALSVTRLSPKNRKESALALPGALPCQEFRSS